MSKKGVQSAVDKALLPTLLLSALMMRMTGSWQWLYLLAYSNKVLMH